MEARGAGLNRVIESYLSRIRGGAKVTPPSPADGGIDRVTLSPKAQEALKMREALRTVEMPAGRREDVLALKRQVAEGQYRVSGKDVAGKIARDIQEDGSGNG